MNYYILFLICRKSIFKLYKKFYVDPEAENLLIISSIIKGKIDHLEYFKKCDSSCRKDTKFKDFKRKIL